MIHTWIANTLLISAYFAVGYKWRPAFLLTAVGEVIYVVECVRIDRWDMAWLCIVFAAIAIRNYRRWGREQS